MKGIEKVKIHKDKENTRGTNHKQIIRHTKKYDHV